jgi:peroxiredoxin
VLVGKKPRLLIRNGLGVLLVLLVGVGGLVAGRELRASRPFQEPPLDAEHRPWFEVGDAFPDVMLEGERRAGWSTRELVSGGAIVLFLDLDCPPCTDVAISWQETLESGRELPPIVGVTSADPDRAADYREEMAITFPIYSDRERRFRTEWNVRQYPLQVIVDGDGTVDAVIFDDEAALVASR